MLKAVEIKNFRSCHSTRIDFDGTLCAISGRNGVGKSNILKAIEWACESVIVTDRIRLGPSGNLSEKLDELSFRFDLRIGEQIYEYHFQVPMPWSRPTHWSPAVTPGLQERLLVVDVDGSKKSVFARDSESIQVADRTEQIRIPRSTPALASLFALLAIDDPYREHIERLISFFSGMRYYSLDDRPDASDYVKEQAYNEWKFRYQTEGELTKSVAMRLIYMWQEDRDLFNELLQILGPEGLNVVESIDITPIEQRSSSYDISKDAAMSSTKLFMPMVWPSAHMGGAGEFFPFSSLSVGTRRVIRIIASMLFDKRSLMLMEQPEDSIHPGLLRKLIDQIRTYSFETQMLFTTHSLTVLDILRPEEIRLATAPGGSTKVRKLTPDEIQRAKEFLNTEGSLSDFLEPLDDLE